MVRILGFHPGNRGSTPLGAIRKVESISRKVIMKNPMQPIGLDEDGVVRFKRNAIVRLLLDTGKLTLNDLACMPFSQTDWEQFYQLIGYSVSGYGDLSSVSEESVAFADGQADGLRKNPDPPLIKNCY